MSLRFRNSQGTETPVAGLNGTSGELVPSVALKQSGSVASSLNKWVIPYYYSDNANKYFCYVYYKVGTGNLFISLGSSVANYWPIGTKVYCVLEYTKSE